MPEKEVTPEYTREVIRQMEENFVVKEVADHVGCGCERCLNQAKSLIHRRLGINMMYTDAASGDRVEGIQAPTLVMDRVMDRARMVVEVGRTKRAKEVSRPQRAASAPRRVFPS